jgi:ERCC4-type nuclease
MLFVLAYLLFLVSIVFVSAKEDGRSEKLRRLYAVACDLEYYSRLKKNYFCSVIIAEVYVRGLVRRKKVAAERKDIYDLITSIVNG